MNYVIVTDIPGAFSHMDMEGTVHMILEGETRSLLSNLTQLYIEIFLAQPERKSYAILAIKGGSVTISTIILEIIIRHVTRVERVDSRFMIATRA